ncbi:P-loop containing nucleoside triphosphate hydrolase protein [Trichoderma sp. SZMC 28015]
MVLSEFWKTVDVQTDPNSRSSIFLVEPEAVQLSAEFTRSSNSPIQRSVSTIPDDLSRETPTGTQQLNRSSRESCPNAERDHDPNISAFNYISQHSSIKSTSPVNSLKRKRSITELNWNPTKQFKEDFSDLDELVQSTEIGDSSADNHDRRANTTGCSNISPRPTLELAASVRPLKRKESAAAQEWVRRKKYGEYSSALDELMEYQGLEEVKQHFLDIKSKVDIFREQDPDGTMNIIKSERFNTVFQGNPGTGKTTVARLYAKFLYEEEILESEYIEETSGIQVALHGARGMRSIIDNMTKNEGGGVVFIDEAYQLMAAYVDRDGKQALDIILAVLENNIGTLAAVFVGYKDDMIPFFEHNPGLESRIPYTVNFADFNDGELWHIFTDKIRKQYGGSMSVEGDLDGLYVRIAIRRLAQGRGSRGFGNARAVENLLARIRQRQASRLTREKNEMGDQTPNYLLLTKEDLIGPDPSVTARSCPAWVKLQELIGLDEVKQSAERLIGMIELNYQRELREEPPLRFSLNQLFVGAPGTGKTTVAKLYGQILVDLGYLSRGDIVLKTPADFIGDCVGKSESKTEMILESTVGKVLVIDEAYMLDAGDSQKDQDKFKTGIIDTIVSMTQGVPGEDRCIILVGYENKIHDLFQNANPGLSRRFPVKTPFHFKDFTIDQLEEILRIKLLEENLIYTDDALVAARELLAQALMRPSFTNAGEVNSIINAAKMNYETRLSRLPLREKLFATTLEAIDFDPEFVQRGNLEPGNDKTLEGLVDGRIIHQLAVYQRSYYMAKKLKLDPRSMVPTNFILKGPPGTGKKTVARQLGKIFYGMGFVSSKDVVECSATDLIGQYVGHTAPKTRKKLQDGLGHVLTISESGRLMSSSFAAEAVEELLQFLANPSNVGRIVVVLTGLTADMDKLLAQYPTLSGLFPEEIAFEALSPDDCIKILLRELESSGIPIKVDALTNTSSEDYCKVRRLFRTLSAQSGWSNARDVKNLVKQTIRRRIHTLHPADMQLELSITCDNIIGSMDRMISQRRGRSQITVPDRRSSGPALEAHQHATEPPKLRKDIYNNIPDTLHNNFSSDTSGLHHDLAGNKAFSQSDSFMSQQDDSSATDGGKARKMPVKETDAMREEGVSDADWQSLCEKKKEQGFRSLLRAMKVQTLKRQLTSFEEKEDEENIKKFQERLQEAQKNILEEEKIQKSLREMGRCVAGYSWIRDGDGYRCAGGACYVSDKELSEKS